MKIALRYLAALVAALGFSATGASAATLTATGATGVSVTTASGTRLYDVEFGDGTCADVFGGCSPSFFTFTTSAEADAASSALLSLIHATVSPDIDGDPRVTGCSNIYYCGIFTPYDVDVVTNEVLVSDLVNYGSLSGGTDQVFTPEYFGVSDDSTGIDSVTYARWTLAAVPVPASLPLLIGGLAGLAALRRKSRRTA